VLHGVSLLVSLANTIVYGKVCIHGGRSFMCVTECERFRIDIWNTL
jgi:hypothetical protein